VNYGRLWKAAPAVAGFLTVAATIVGAVAHQEFKVWDIAFYAGATVLMMGAGAIPGMIIFMFVESSVSEENYEMAAVLCIAGCALVLVILLSSYLNPDETDTFGRVAFSAIGVGGIAYAWYKFQEQRGE
jgi:hypothetical protein